MKKLTKSYPYLLIVTLICLTYIQNLNFDYSYLDDNLIIFQDFNQINSISKIPDAFASGYLLGHYYRPLIMISFILDTAIAGQSPMMYHATNLIIHIIFTLLLFRFLIKFKIDKAIATFCSLIFAIHPININAISWIVGRNDLIVGLFSLLSILAFINFIQKNKFIYYFAHLLFFVLAMFSKEIGIMIPLVLILFLYLIEKQYLKDIKKIVLLLIPWGMLVLVYLYFRFLVASINPQEQVGLSILLKNFYILFEYTGKLIYLPGIIPLSLKNNQLILIGSIFSGIILFIVLKKREYRNKKFLWGLLVFLLFIIPSLMVRLQTKDGGFVYLDCRMYLPFIGLLLALGIFLNEIRIKKNISFLLYGIILTYFLVFSFIKNQPYKDGEHFWTAVTNDHPEAPYNWIGMGFYYFDKGNYLKAAKYAEKAIEINPTIDPEFYHKAALAYEKAGDIARANSFIEKSMSLQEDNSLNLAILIKNNLMLGNYDKAMKLKGALEKMDFKDLNEKEKIYSSIAIYFSNARHYREAIDLMQTAVNCISSPNPNDINNLGAFYFNISIKDSAKIYFKKALNLDPGNSAYIKNLSLTNR